LIIVTGMSWTLPILIMDGLPPQPIQATVLDGRWEGDNTFILNLLVQDKPLKLTVSGPSPADLYLGEIKRVDAQTSFRPDGLRRLVCFFDETGAVVGVIGENQQLGVMLLDTFAVLPGSRLGPAPEPRRDTVEVILKKDDFEIRVAPGISQKVEIGNRLWVFTCFGATVTAAQTSPMPSTGSSAAEAYPSPSNPQIADESAPFSVDYTLFPAPMTGE